MPWTRQHQGANLLAGVCLQSDSESEDDDESEPVKEIKPYTGCMPENHRANMSFSSGVCALALLAAVISMNSELLVGVVEEVTKDTWMTEVFVGVILLPIVGNAAEHLTAVTAAYKNKVNLSLSIAIGKTLPLPSVFALPSCL